MVLSWFLPKGNENQKLGVNLSSFLPQTLRHGDIVVLRRGHLIRISEQRGGSGGVNLSLHLLSKYLLALTMNEWLCQAEETNMNQPGFPSQSRPESSLRGEGKPVPCEV